MKRMQASPASNESFNASLHFLLHFFTCSAAKLQFLLLPGRGVSSKGVGGLQCIACVRNSQSFRTRNAQQQQQRGTTRQIFHAPTQFESEIPALQQQQGYLPRPPQQPRLPPPTLPVRFGCLVYFRHLNVLRCRFTRLYLPLSPTLSPSLCCSLLLCCLRCLRLLSVF